VLDVGYVLAERLLYMPTHGICLLLAVGCNVVVETLLGGQLLDQHDQAAPTPTPQPGAAGSGKAAGGGGAAGGSVGKGARGGVMFYALVVAICSVGAVLCRNPNRNPNPNPNTSFRTDCGHLQRGYSAADFWAAESACARRWYWIAQPVLGLKPSVRVSNTLPRLWEAPF
jgi:hypothetical protein